MVSKRKDENINDFRKRIYEYNKKYREENREHVREYNKLYFREYRKEYDKTHKEERAKWSSECRKRVHDSLIKLLGGVCVICFTDKQLEIDHISGGGRAERLIRFDDNRIRMYNYYLAHPKEAKKKLQVLCKVHNKEKRKMLKESKRVSYAKKWRDYYSDTKNNKN